MKRPRDPNQLAKLVVDIATGQVDDTASESRRNPPTRGRAGGLAGGLARARALPAKKRTAIAAKAASARWGKKI